MPHPKSCHTGQPALQRHILTKTPRFFWEGVRGKVTEDFPRPSIYLKPCTATTYSKYEKLDKLV